MDFQANLAAFLKAHLASADRVEVGQLQAMPAGASNETAAIGVFVTCDGMTFELPLVLRRQRITGILAPYDVGRQFAVMRALQRTAVPVPAVAWLETDPSVLGAPFFLMGLVKGETLPLVWYGGRSPRLEAIAEALATVHAVDWRAAGLTFLLPEGADPDLPPAPLSCQLAQWRARATHLGVADHPAVVSLGGFLAANEPADARHSFLHGDPNPGNYLLRGDTVAAVVDWELAAIGDPRSDLGFYAALLAVFGGMPAEGGHTVLSAAYEGVTGKRLTNLDYYEASGLYRMAIVMAGSGWQTGPALYGTDAISRRLSALLGPRWAG